MGALPVGCKLREVTTGIKKPNGGLGSFPTDFCACVLSEEHPERNLVAHSSNSSKSESGMESKGKMGLKDGPLIKHSKAVGGQNCKHDDNAQGRTNKQGEIFSSLNPRSLRP
jgi:hypothetical protein